ncbi:hypothetical protein [Streptomyces sp. NPDC089799]|uniref:hypothetical protein n=1 Tax=Streptomyces sp. NPDC089799 TaxID=3155066 RepID=UPI003443664C
MAARTRPARGNGTQARLTWWGMALPALAFSLLVLLLLGGPAEAGTTPGTTDASVLGLLAQEILRLLG